MCDDDALFAAPEPEHPGAPAGPLGFKPPQDGLVCRACVFGSCKTHPGDTHGYGGGARD